MRSWITAAAGMAVCLLVAVAPGDEVAPPAPAEGAPATPAPEAVELRTYDITELIQPPQDYPLAAIVQASETNGGGGNGGGGLFGGALTPSAVPADSRTYQERSDGVIRLIEEMVAPESWRDLGGKTGAVRVAGGFLIIAQTPANQKAIQALLDGMYKDRQLETVIEIDADWLLLSAQQLAELEKSAGDKPGGATWPRAVSTDLLKDERALYCRARTAGFNGQTTSVVGTRTASVVKSATPVVGAGVALYDLATDREQNGVALQITPRLARDRETIIVDIHSLVSEAEPGAAASDVPLPALVLPSTRPTTTQRAAEAAREVAKVISRAGRVEQTFRTTVRLTPGTPAVISGMTMEPGKPGSRQLYLVLTARIVEPAGKPAR